VGFNTECFGTEIVPVGDLRPAIIAALDLIRPIYSQVTKYGHFGRELDIMTWDRTDRADALARWRELCGADPCRHTRI
jgi:S-adenosylmethionine synthetase